MNRVNRAIHRTIEDERIRDVWSRTIRSKDAFLATLHQLVGDSREAEAAGDREAADAFLLTARLALLNLNQSAPTEAREWTGTE